MECLKGAHDPATVWGWESRRWICIVLVIRLVREWIMSAGTVTSLSFSRTESIGLIRSRAECQHGKEYTGLLLIGGKFFKILLLRIYWLSERTIAAIGYGSPHKEWNLLNTCACSQPSTGNLSMCRALQPVEIQI